MYHSLYRGSSYNTSNKINKIGELGVSGIRWPPHGIQASWAAIYNEQLAIDLF